MSERPTETLARLVRAWVREGMAKVILKGLEEENRGDRENVACMLRRYGW